MFMNIINGKVIFGKLVPTPIAYKYLIECQIVNK